MAKSPKARWYTKHRRWEDALTALIGAVIILSPILVSSHPQTAVLLTSAITGALIIVLSALEFAYVERWEEAVKFVCGAWLIASPFTLDYSGTLRIWHIILGVLVVCLAALEFWQDRNHSADSR